MLYNFLASSEKPHSVQCNKSSRERQISVANSFVLLHFFSFYTSQALGCTAGRDVAVALWEQTEGQTNTVNFH